MAPAASVLDTPPLYYPATSDYTNESNHTFQGIPGLERSANGRLWATWYSGGDSEGPENYVVLATSGDNGNSWSDVIMAIDPLDNIRAFDPCLWTDPQDRLWFFWAQADTRTTNPGVWAIVTEDPNSAMPTWSEPTRLCDGIMMNKPTVLDNGNWLLPTAIWNTEGSSRVVQSTDNGNTFNLIGQANVPASIRSADEPMIVERDNDLLMYVRTDLGIGQSTSVDNGYTWTDVVPTNLTDTVSRFFLRELDSGNLLLVTNSPPSGTGRSHLTAYLSQNQGTTWQGGLLIDERLGVSYPDGVQDENGTIYLSYDYNRTTDRQILMSTFTEADVLAGTAVSEEARFQVLINQANVYPSPPMGSIVDRTGNGHEARTIRTSVAPANVGGLTEAFSFHDGYIATPDATDTPHLGTEETEGTISAWVKFNEGFMDFSGGWGNALMVGATWDDGTARVELDSDGRIRLAAKLSDGTRSNILTGYTSTEADKWYHLAFSFGVETGNQNLSRTRLVVTDSEGNVSTYYGANYDADLTLDMSDLCFGGMTAALEGADRDSILDGEMTDLRYYDSALSLSEIALLADSDFTTNPASGALVAHYYPTAVPEPGSLMLILTAVFALAGFCRKKT